MTLDEVERLGEVERAMPRVIELLAKITDRANSLLEKPTREMAREAQLLVDDALALLRETITFSSRQSDDEGHER